MHYSVRCGHRGLRPIVARLCLCLCFDLATESTVKWRVTLCTAFTYPPTTATQLTGSTEPMGNGTTTSVSSTNCFTILIIIFSILDACALFWLIGMCCFWPELTDPRRRRRKVRRIRKNYRSYNFWKLIQMCVHAQITNALSPDRLTNTVHVTDP